MTQNSKQFHSYIIKNVYNTRTNKQGWRIVGIWGDEDKGEGNRIGPTFDYGDLESCEKLIDNLVAQYQLPVCVHTIAHHFTPTDPEPKEKPKIGITIEEIIDAEDHGHTIRSLIQLLGRKQIHLDQNKHWFIIKDQRNFCEFCGISYAFGADNECKRPG